MRKDELFTGVKVWCWWKSRYLYYTGTVLRGKYKFVDDLDAITMIAEKDLMKLKKATHKAEMQP